MGGWIGNGVIVYMLAMQSLQCDVNMRRSCSEECCAPTTTISPIRLHSLPIAFLFTIRLRCEQAGFFFDRNLRCEHHPSFFTGLFPFSSHPNRRAGKGDRHLRLDDYTSHTPASTYHMSTMLLSTIRMHTFSSLRPYPFLDARLFFLLPHLRFSTCVHLWIESDRIAHHNIPS